MFVEQASKRFREKGGHEEIRDLTRDLAHAVSSVGTGTHDAANVNGYARRIVRRLANYLNGDDGLSAQLAIVKEFRHELSADWADELCQEAASLISRLEQEIVNVFSSHQDPTRWDGGSRCDSGRRTGRSRRQKGLPGTSSTPS
jgi:hypothetical protein